MISPESIDLTTLPSVALSVRATLPLMPAIYWLAPELPGMLGFDPWGGRASVGGFHSTNYPSEWGVYCRSY